MLLKNLKMIIILSAFIALLPGVSNASISVLGGLRYVKNLQPGESYRGSIVIKNNANKITQLKIYQTDYLFFSDGTNIYGKPGQDARSNAKWIEFNPDHLIIPPSGTD